MNSVPTSSYKPILIADYKDYTKGLSMTFCYVSARLSRVESLWRRLGWQP